MGFILRKCGKALFRNHFTNHYSRFVHSLENEMSTKCRHLRRAWKSSPSWGRRRRWTRTPPPRGKSWTRSRRRPSGRARGAPRQRCSSTETTLGWVGRGMTAKYIGSSWFVSSWIFVHIPHVNHWILKLSLEASTLSQMTHFVLLSSRASLLCFASMCPCKLCLENNSMSQKLHFYFFLKFKWDF